MHCVAANDLRGISATKRCSLLFFFPSTAALRSGQNLTGATTSKDHPFKAQYAKDMGGSVRHKWQPDLVEVVEYLTIRRRPKMNRAEAELKARSKSYARYVRSFSRSKEHTKADLTKRFDVYVRMDKEAVGRGELPLLNPEVPRGKNGPLGAKTALKNLLSCVDKGCCQDPMDVDGM